MKKEILKLSGNGQDVLFVSRHRLSEKQIKSLQYIIGEIRNIHWYKLKNETAKKLVEKINSGGFNIVVVVLPMKIIAEAFEKTNARFFRSCMKREIVYNTEGESTHSIFRFSRWEEITEISYKSVEYSLPKEFDHLEDEQEILPSATICEGDFEEEDNGDNKKDC